MLSLAPRARALDVPPLTGRVVDLAHVLSPEAVARLDGRLAAYEKETGQQFALLTEPTLAGDSIEDFSIRVVDQWRLGRKGKDDGLLLLVVPSDRRVRIEVGRGLEGDVTDAVSARVIRNVLGPAFRSGDYAGGIDQAFSLLMRVASGKEPATPAEDEPEAGKPAAPNFFVILVLLLVLGPWVLALFSRRRRWGGGGGMFWGGGGFGGGGFGGGGFGGGGGFSGGGGGFGGGGSSGSW